MHYQGIRGIAGGDLARQPGTAPFLWSCRGSSALFGSVGKSVQTVQTCRGGAHLLRRRSLNNEAIVCLEAGLGHELLAVDQQLAEIRALRNSLGSHSFDPAEIDAFKREGRS